MSNEQAIGGSVPELLDSVGGQAFSLRVALHRKRAAVVLFWSGVCSHCTRYDKYLNSFSTRRPNVSLTVIACRQEETPQQVEAAAANRGLRFPILFDTDRQVAHAWLVQQTPRVFLVDTEMRLVYRGAIDNFKYETDSGYQPYLETAINELLARRPISRAETSSFGCPIESVYYSLPKPMAR